VSAIVAESLELNKLTDAYLRITVSRGHGEIGLDPALCKNPTLVVIAMPLSRILTSFYTDGVSVQSYQTRRNLPEALPPHVKSLNLPQQHSGEDGGDGARSLRRPCC